jgi:DNA-binding NtrC family response regulator
MASMSENQLHILVVEDDILSRLALVNKLAPKGKIAQASSLSSAREILAKEKIDLAFVDLDLEIQLAGLDLLSELKASGVYSIVTSGRVEEKIIERAYDVGCNDYLSKPYSSNSIDKMFNRFEISNKRSTHLEKLKNLFHTEDIEMIDELIVIEESLHSTRPLLITGESGVGKTYLAKFIHSLVNEHAPFIHLNCAEISEGLIESELFGFKKGAFTGAHQDKSGLLELAHGGILFLDEIATLPISLQKKLLKAIEEKSFFPLGSEKPVHSNFRLISATCENLRQKIERGEFRLDLFYRLEGFNIELKPLRKRKADLWQLVDFFIHKGDRKIVFEKAAKEKMKSYAWPGNLRELERVVEILQAKSAGVVKLSDLEKQLVSIELKTSATEIRDEIIAQIGLKAYLEKLEVEIVLSTLAKNNDHVRKTLSDLKLSNNAYYRILENAKNESIR